MAYKKVLVVGSGDDLHIDVSNFDVVYAANSSFTRLSDTKNLTLVLSDAMLLSLDDLNNREPILGMERAASNELRMKKYAVLDGHDFKKISVIDNGDINIELALKRKRMSVDNLSLIDHRRAWQLLSNSFSFSELKFILYSIKGSVNKLRFCLQWLTNKKMHVGFRPSTGIYSLMLAFHENPAANVYVNGINVINDDEKRVSKYSAVELPFQKHVHLLDSLYFELFLNRDLRIHNENK